MGLFDWMDCKEERKDKKGNKYIYNLSTKEIKKDNGRQKYRIGFADTTEEFKMLVEKEDK